ncbi:MAG: CPBP family intramembrane metalloprotease [Deltaproteobacteria bacterium]|nr:CPBP family intramembrane metalloprotease [Deltaproteobacteria bacterium]
MSPLAAARIIWAKELLEALRDRKTLIIMVVLPLVIYPLVFIGLSQATMAQRERIEAEQLSLGLAGAEPPEALRSALDALEASELLHVDDAAAAVGQGEVAAALTVPEDAVATLAAGGQVPITVVFDGSDDRSHEAESRLRRAVTDFITSVRAQRLADAKLSPEYIDPVALSTDNVAPPARQGGFILGQILPMLVSFLMIGAAFYPAIDLTAGEKERGTLQTLLTAPIPSISIVAGKFAAVVTLSIITGALNLLALGLVAASIPLPDELQSQIVFSVAPLPLLLLLVCMVLLGMMFGALMMAVAVTARSFKDAQSYLTPLYLLCIFPLMVSSLPGVTLGPLTAAFPVVNLALAMKQLLLGVVDWPLLAVTGLTTLAFAALALTLAARVFSMQAVLLGGDGPSALFRRRDGGTLRPPVPTPGEATTVLALVLLSMFYGTLALSGAPLILIIHATQWLFILCPPLLAALGLRLDLRQTFALRRPPLWALAAAAALGSGLWLAALRLLEHLSGDWLPVPSPGVQALGEALASLGADPRTAIPLFAGVALAPALCEEALFRGFLLQSLRRNLSDRSAILLSAALFALYHLEPAQMPTTFVIGLIQAALVIRSRSLWPAVLLHFLHNGLALASQLYLPEELLHGTPILALLLLPAAGLALLATRRRGAGTP